jgi:hypothetical protein
VGVTDGHQRDLISDQKLALAISHTGWTNKQLCAMNVDQGSRLHRQII